jgi:hypothetical protein
MGRGSERTDQSPRLAPLPPIFDARARAAQRGGFGLLVPAVGWSLAPSPAAGARSSPKSASPAKVLPAPWQKHRSVTRRKIFGTKVLHCDGRYVYLTNLWVIGA